MPFIPVNDVAQVVLEYKNALQQIRTVLDFKLTGGGDLDEGVLSDLADAVNTAWDTHMQGEVNAATTYLGCVATDLTTETGTSVERLLVSPLVGTGGGTPLPNNVTLAVKKVTLLRGRSFRGRIYHPCLSSGMVLDTTQANPAFVTDLISKYNLFIAAIEGTTPGWTHVVVSRFSGMENVTIDGRFKRRPIPRVAGVTTAVTDFASDGFLDSQRRRLAGRGI